MVIVVSTVITPH